MRTSASKFQVGVAEGAKDQPILYGNTKVVVLVTISGHVKLICLHQRIVNVLMLKSPLAPTISVREAKRKGFKHRKETIL